MGITPEQAYAISVKRIQEITEGITMIEGKPCTIASITEITGGHRVTYRWTANDGTTKTQTMDVMDGAQGPQGVKGDTGNTGATGAQGPAGADGTSATIRVGNVTSGAAPTITNSGTNLNAVFDFVLPKGDKGDKGDKGEDGQNGSSFSIRSRFATYDELIAAYPDGPENEGDAYFVGTTASPDLYIWLVDEHEWHNNGPIAGVKGDKGDQGDEGFSPVANVTKDGGVATITIRDKTGTTTQQVSDGADGDDGQDGADGKSAYDIAVDEGFVGTKAEWLASLKGETGAAGANGTNGTDGVSPVANVTKTDDVIKIHIEDSTGTTEEEIDMSDYQKKDLASAVEGQTTVEGALGALSTNKASKVSGATNGDIATLDANGNLVDSGASIKNGGTKVLALKGNDNLHPADLNNLTEAGVYSIISQGSSHLPNTEYLTWWQIIVITKSNTSANQGYCTQYAMARNNLVYMRDCEAGTWSSWEKLVTESEIPKTKIYTYTDAVTAGDNIILDPSSSHDWWNLFSNGNILSISIASCDTANTPDVGAWVGTTSVNHSLILRPSITSSNSYYQVLVAYTGVSL